MTTARLVVDTERAPALRSWAFASMWAIANIVHLVNQELAQLTSPAAWLNLAAAIWLLRRPSPHRLALLAASQLLETVWVAPLAPDHAVLAAWVNIVILLAYGRARLRDGVVEPGAVVTSTIGALRALVLVAYSAAALAKYNDTFLDPELSCAPFIAEAARLGLFPDDTLFDWVHIGAAIGPETVIPVLLVLPWTRRYGVRFGILFHFLVSFSPAIGVWDFTAALFALFALFLSDEEAADAIRLWRERRDERVPHRHVKPLYDLVMAVPDRVRWVGFVLLAGAFGFVSEVLVILALWGAFSIYGIRLLRVGVRTLRLPHRPDALFRGLTVPQGGIAIAMVLYVSMPYIGLRTDGVFTMFSNLRTEGPGTNHLFLPSWHVVDLQNDLVVLVESNDEKLAELAEDGQQIPRFEVERILGADDDLYVVEATESGEVRLGAGGTAIEPPGPLVSRLLHFRAVAASGDPMCTN